MSTITNSGLDAFGASGLASWVNYAGLSTDSATFDNTTATLSGEVAALRTSNAGGFAVSTNYTTPTNKVRRTYKFYRVWNFTASYNLTKWGLFATVSGGSISALDFFRTIPGDSNSAAISLSVGSGDQLQLIIDEVVELDLIQAAGSVSIAGVNGGNAITTSQGFFTSAVPTATHYGNLFNMFDPTSAPGSGTASNVTFYAINAAGSTQTGVQQLPSSHGAAGVSTGVFTHVAYSAGNYFRDRQCEFNTSYGAGTIDIYGWYALFGSSSQGGHKVHLVTPASFQKTSTQKLRVTVRSSWARL
jgi:hypothetical protein